MLYVANAEVLDSTVFNGRTRKVNNRMITRFEPEPNGRVDHDGSWFNLGDRTTKRNTSNAGVIFFPYTPHIQLVDQRLGESRANNNVVSNGKATRTLHWNAVRWCPYVRAEPDGRADNILPATAAGETNTNDGSAAHSCG